MASPPAFLPGSRLALLPLERFLPPLPQGAVSTWLQDKLLKGSWILDPFGAAPQLAVEMARAGYRVAVAANNPIARFLLQVLAQSPTSEDLQAAFADLATARRAEGRLEPHILELYTTRCPTCGELSPAQAFIWAREAQTPQAKLVDCPHCGERGEHPTDNEDNERAASFINGGPHRARALERIAPHGDRDRVHAEEALEAYLPRAVYALFTILNKLDGLEISAEKKRLLNAILLVAMDRANTLWAHPSGRSRPKQLGAPPLFREHNIWHELEAAIELWAGAQGEIEVINWPEAPGEEGGISLFQGRLREMSNSLSETAFKAIVTALPRPNQAYWTLSALWAGWLWGREGIGPFGSVLRRRRYDWAWHSEALRASLSRLTEPIPADTPFLGLIGESEAGFNAAALAAANLAGFRLEGIALRRDEDQAQFHWRRGTTEAEEKGQEPTEAARIAAQQLLKLRGEPSHFLHLQGAALSELSKYQQLGSKQREAGEVYSETRATLEVGLTFRGGFLRFGGSESSLEAGQWWLTDESEARSPLADRVEIAVVRYLLRFPGRTGEEIDRAICGVFPGLLTPPASLLTACLSSYGEQIEGAWHLSEADTPKARRADLAEIRSLLGELGEQLGYSVEQDSPIKWLADEKPLFNFHVQASALLGETLLKAKKSQGKDILVLPGGRAELVLIKLRRDPRLSQIADEGWQFLKFRHARRLAENKSLNRESFDELLGLDPLTEDQAQAPLL